MHSAELETLVAVLRVYPDGLGRGDPYSWCCTVRRLDDETAELCGVMRAPTLGEARAIMAALRLAGFRRTVETRIVDGRRRMVEHRLTS